MTKRILAIDGGGIRGLVPASILTELSRRIDAIRAAVGKPPKPLHQCFDMIAGTSTGGIIACGLVAPAKGKPQEAACTPADLMSLYLERGRDIFPSSIFGMLRQLSAARYEAAPIEKILHEYLGQSRIRDALTNVVVPAYDIVARQAVFMVGGPDLPDQRDYFLRDVARATSAAPTYFAPARTQILGSVQPPLSLVDGGVFANDPGMCALIEGLKLGWPMTDIEILSIGTGSQNRPFSYFEARDWGALSWVTPSKGSPILSILMQGASSTTSYQLARLLPATGGVERYTRINGILSANDEMDDASDENLEMLSGLANTWIGKFDHELADWAKRLAG